MTLPPTLWTDIPSGPQAAPDATTTTRHPVSGEESSSFSGSGRIGELFIQSGRLTSEDVDRIVQKQQVDNIRFGDAALALGLLQEGEVQLALSRQYQYATASTDPALASFPIAYAPHSPEAEAIRKLRTQMLLNLDANHTQSIAVVSPNGEEDKSYIAASLALAFAQNGKRTLLINANLRESQNSGLLNAQRQQGLSSVLSGRHSIEHSLTTPNFPRLNVLDAGPLPPNPAELLVAPALLKLIEHVHERFDIIILDTPPSNLFPDTQLIAQQVDACIIVALQHKTLLSDILKTKRLLQTAGGKLLGSVYSTRPQIDIFQRLVAPSNVIRHWWQTLRRR